jgi:hypothetical protein
VPGPFPVPDPPDTLATVLDDDLVLPGVFLLVPRLPFDDLLRGLGPDVLRHLRVVEPHEERKVLRALRLDTRDGPVEHAIVHGHRSEA